MNKNLISVSGKINSGKDLVTLIIRVLTHTDEVIKKEFYKDPIKFIKYYETRYFDSSYENKKFAYKTKVTVANLLGCTINKLEQNDFKNKELPTNWWYYLVYDKKIPYLSTDLSEEFRSENLKNLVKLTPRRLLVLLGTGVGRNIIHPDIWVNGLFSDYVHGVSKWVISDLRFMNELNKVNELESVTIRIFRYKKLGEWLKIYDINFIDTELEDTTFSDVEFTNYINDCGYTINEDLLKILNHESEVELDAEKFTEIIDNDGTINELINKIYMILVKYGIIEKIDGRGGLC